MRPLEPTASRIPIRTLHLVRDYEHVSTVQACAGDMLGVMGTRDTFVRQNDAWVATTKQEVLDIWQARGLVYVNEVPAPPAPKKAGP